MRIDGCTRAASAAPTSSLRLPSSLVIDTEPTAGVVVGLIVGRGAADKQQIQHMIRILLNLKQVLQADAADAAAVALCHLHHSQGGAGLLAAAQAR